MCVRLACRNHVETFFSMCMSAYFHLYVCLYVCGAHVCVHSSGSQRLMLGVLLGHSTFLFTVYHYVYDVWSCVLCSTYVEARGQFVELVLFFHLFMKSGDRSQVP